MRAESKINERRGLLWKLTKQAWLTSGETGPFWCFWFCCFLFDDSFTLVKVCV